MSKFKVVKFKRLKVNDLFIDNGEILEKMNATEAACVYVSSLCTTKAVKQVKPSTKVRMLTEFEFSMLETLKKLSKAVEDYKKKLDKHVPRGK